VSARRGYTLSRKRPGQGIRQTVGVTDVMDEVSQLLREAAHEVVLPVFGHAGATAEEKAPGEWVTVADRAAESFLAPRLAALLPGSVVIGEEMASADAGLLMHLQSASDAWLLDPLDGTANFAAGTGPFAMMAALIRHGQAVASWILNPQSGQLAYAEHGAGAWLDGRQIKTDSSTPSIEALKGAVLRRFLPDTLAEHMASAEPRFAELSSGTGCAGADYPAIVTGILDFTLYWRTLPWDHSPGVLFVSEAGGAAHRLDGSAYLPAQHARPGLLVARNAATWRQVLAALVPSPSLMDTTK
jgi:fructose-1,6-bisphosphatase/inositol monophosphatase family enzyme